MTRSDLITRLSQRNPAVSADQFDRIVKLIFETMSHQLVAGGRVEIRGFGAFSIRDRAAASGRNPRTGEVVDLGTRRLVYFRPGKEARELISGGNGRNQGDSQDTVEPII